MSSKYTKREFQKDLKKLAQLIEEHDKLERKSRRTRRQRGGDDTATHSEGADQDTAAHDAAAHDAHDVAGEDADQTGGKRRSKGRKGRRQRGGDSDWAPVQDGGKRRSRGRSRSRSPRRRRGGAVDAHDPNTDVWGPLTGGKAPKRTFKVVSVNGKAVNFGNYTITKDSPIGPGRAASKAASSVCAHVTGKTGKHSIGNQCDGVKFMLKEKTRGSNQKEFGPYVVKVHKRSHAELKDLEKRFNSFGKGKYKPSYYIASAVLVHGK